MYAPVIFKGTCMWYMFTVKLNSLMTQPHTKSYASSITNYNKETHIYYICQEVSDNTITQWWW